MEKKVEEVKIKFTKKEILLMQVLVWLEKSNFLEEDDFEETSEGYVFWQRIYDKLELSLSKLKDNK